MCPVSGIYTSFLVIHMTDAHDVQSDRKKKKERGAFVSVESFLVPLYFPFRTTLLYVPPTALPSYYYTQGIH